MTSDRLFLAVDGGATHCRARLTDEHGAILGEGAAGPASSRLGIPTMLNEVTRAAKAALREAGLPAARIASLHAGLGLAGLSLEADRAALLAHPHPFAAIAAASDAYTACLGAHGGADGGIVILGTGSNACAIVDGEVVTLGGWGFLLGDQGAAARLGLRAVRQALLSHEGLTEPSDLSDTLMRRFDGSPEQAVLWAADAKPGDFGALAPFVVDHARSGDAMATALMWETGQEAARLIERLHDRGAKRIALLGGFAPHLRPWLPERNFGYLVEAAGDALDGALLLIRRKAEPC